MKRRQIMLGTAALATLAVGGGAFLMPNPARAEEQVFEDDRILGDPAAPVTIIEYASLTCPHCARFHSDTLPPLKDSWIKDGRARLVYRDYPLDRVALTGAMIAHCFDGDRAYFAFVDMLYQQQARWSRAENPLEELASLAKIGGMSRERFDACLQDEAQLNRILEKLKHAQETYKIEATPSFVIGGEVYRGGRSFEDLEKILEGVAPKT
ncbi:MULTISPECIES: DsbA family protein [Limibacillus]|jgi:protein-disulfide isomerase|uniref:Protein-disulfide isomerase n=1 Tax=Limibacillus halophilus TaxID=1579333 RepID=A0A839STY4_9PROT|nr:DsbA family protein [Limibacillus halophilus]MBB3065952.1 protein-disulfide isomerase [Limibacillus halophilus]